MNAVGDNALLAKLDTVEAMLRDISNRLPQSPVVCSAKETATRLGISRTTLFRLGKSNAEVRMFHGRTLRRGKYNIEAARRALECEKNDREDLYMARPRRAK